MKKVKKNYMDETKDKRKKMTARRLYIVSAISMATIGIVTLIIVSQVSRSVTKWNENEVVSIPTQKPVDTVITSPFTENNQLAKPTPQPTQKPKSTAKPAAKEEPAAEAGLFSSKKEEQFTIKLPVEGGVLHEFSMKKLQKSKTMGDWRVHKGVDIKCDLGTAVYSAADGVVEKAYLDNSMGNTIVIKHSDSYQTVYSNLTTLEMVEVGKKIKKGDCISAVGDSAVYEKLEEGHLHFELIENGICQDPILYVLGE